jgi:integrase
VTHRVQKLAAKAGVPVIRFHDIRHTTGAFLADIGAEQLLIMEYLRHIQINTSARYTHIRERITHDAADRIGGLLAEAG